MVSNISHVKCLALHPDSDDTEHLENRFKCQLSTDILHVCIAYVYLMLITILSCFFICDLRPIWIVVPGPVTVLNY